MPLDEFQDLAPDISIHALLAESDRFMQTALERIKDFYPRSPCGERLRRALAVSAGQGISIHALLAESDLTQEVTTMATPKFLSTLSLRRATCGALWQRCALSYFYPRSPCGERPVELTTLVNKLFISIHALLAESDLHH